jgi:hypothetical protein
LALGALIGGQQQIRLRLRFVRDDVLTFDNL